MQFCSVLDTGRNSDYLIGHQVKAKPILKNKPTRDYFKYIFSSGNETAERVSQKTLDRNNLDLVLATAQGEIR
jgi:putative glycerol-1-phosphate prenyltransferase